jgi:predicted nucleic acid-binding protein
VIILDTNVISELMRPNGSPGVFRWVAGQPGADLYTTAICEAEVFYGIELVSRGKRHTELLSAAEKLFGVLFLNRVLAFDSLAARAYPRIVANRRKLGRPIEYADAQIAAIAQYYGARLATRDVAGFVDCDIRVIDPWHS